ncbi:Regulator of chromosome condensation family protein [Perilla frutescens var. frutescens]|nr:Regulator of chromosome condensation family protein [Perilla frutescens var. frutescens]
MHSGGCGSYYIGERLGTKQFLGFSNGPALRSLSFLYGNSQFDDATYASGDFMPSQTTQITDPSFSLAKSRDTQGLLPLTVKQISEAFQASDDRTNFLIDGVDVNNCGQGSTDDELSLTCVSSLLGIKIDGVAAGLWHTICFFADVFTLSGEISLASWELVLIKLSLPVTYACTDESVFWI